jgi:hypothetical protein
VDFTDGSRGVAGLAELAEHVWQAAGVRSAQTVIAMVVAVLAGEETHATWRADGILDDGVVEPHALGGQAVEIRRFDVGMILMAKTLGAVLVGDDEQNVGAGHVDSRKPVTWLR